MYTKRVLSQEQCNAAIAAVAAEFKKMPGSPRWTMAIVDDAGNLMAFTRSDGAGPCWAGTVSRRPIRRL